MRKQVLLAVLILGGGLLAAFEADAITVRAGIVADVLPGTESVIVPIDLDLSGNESVGGLQVDLSFDPATLAFKSATAGQVVTDAGKRVSSVNLAVDTERFFVSGFNQNAINKGTVINVEFSVAESAAPGESLLFLANLRVVSPTGLTIEATAEPGAVNITGEAPTEGEIPTEGEAPVDGEAPAEGEMPTEGETPPEGEVPVEGDIPPEGAAPPEGDAVSEGETPSASGCSGGIMGGGGNAGGTSLAIILLTAVAILSTSGFGHLLGAMSNISGKILTNRNHEQYRGVTI